MIRLYAFVLMFVAVLAIGSTRRALGAQDGGGGPAKAKRTTAPATRPAARDPLAREIRQMRKDMAEMSRQMAALRAQFPPASAGPTTKEAERSHVATFVLEIAADIDGSDELHLTKDGLSWTHKQWDWPSTVKVNGREWDPHEELKWEAIGAEPVGEDQVVKLSRIVNRDGRDTIAVESQADGVTIYFADTPGGADAYMVKVELQGVRGKPAAE